MTELELLENLERLTTTQFNKLIFISKVPQELLPGENTSQTERAIALLNLAKAPGGIGLHKVETVLGEIIGESDNDPPRGDYTRKSITEEEFLELIDQIMSCQNECLDTKQRQIVKGIYQNKTYDEIAKLDSYNSTNISKTMSEKVFPIITNYLNQIYGTNIKITKRNLYANIERFYCHKKTQNIEQIIDSNTIKIEIFDNLAKQIKQALDKQQQEKTLDQIKTYFKNHYSQKTEIIKSESFKNIFEEIMNEEIFIHVDLFTWLIDDTDIIEKAKTIFDHTLKELKKQLNISEENYLNWKKTIKTTPKSKISEPTPIQEPCNHQNSYLIIKIQKSDNSLIKNNPQYRIESAFFVNSSNYPPQEQKHYESLNEIIESYEIEQQEKEGENYQQYVSCDLLKPLLGRLINKCSEKINLEINSKSYLTIQCFVPKNLLSVNFDCWEYELEEDCTQIRFDFSLHVRSLDRIENDFCKLPNFKSIWESKWRQVHQNFGKIDEDLMNKYLRDPDAHFRDSSIIWVNICTSDVEKLNTLWRKLIKGGIPIALWSRCYQNCQTHRQEINNLVGQCDGKVKELFDVIKRRRSAASSVIDHDSNDLGHHLSLLWEDPHLIPPFTKVTSSDFGKLS